MSPMPEQNPLPFPDAAPPPDPAPEPKPPLEPFSADRRPPVRPVKRPLWAALMSKLADPWLVPSIEPEDPRQYVDDRPVCYVLEDYGLSNALILERACRDAGLPSPLAPLPGDPLGRKRAYVALSRRNASARAAVADLSPGARNRARPRPTPVRWRACSTRTATTRSWTCSWCRCRSSSAARRTRAAAGSRCCSRKTGRWSAASAACWRSCSTAATPLVRFAPPVIAARRSSPRVCRPNAPCASSRACCARTSTASRAAVIGPDLSHRRLLIDQVLRCRARAGSHRQPGRARQASSADRRLEEGARLRLRDRRRLFASGGAFGQLPADAVWNRIYRRRAGRTTWTSSSRSRPGMKWSMCPATAATWTTCCCRTCCTTHGIVPPHIAAGINLNLPVVGTLLRKGGAFFMRRSFRGNPLYSAVFTEYVAQLVAGGYSVRVFHRGRAFSRTGRLLQPKGGMICDDGARVPAPADAAGGVPAGLHRLREADGGQQLSGRTHAASRRKRNRSGRCCGAFPRCCARTTDRWW